MQQNLVYYRFHRARWGLEEGDFQPREVGIASEPLLGPCDLIKKKIRLPQKAGWKVKKYGLWLGSWIQTQPHRLCGPGNTAHPFSICCLTCKMGRGRPPLPAPRWKV